VASSSEAVTLYQCLTISNALQKARRAELDEDSWRRDEAFRSAMRGGRTFSGKVQRAISAVQRQKTVLFCRQLQSKAQEQGTAACKEQTPAVEKELLAIDKITVQCHAWQASNH